jgi:hypothetical protein
VVSDQQNDQQTQKGACVRGGDKFRDSMNWKLIFRLSLFGVAMCIGTVFGLSARVEPFFWLVIFIICAFLIARRVPLRAFLHGLLLGIVNSVWVTAAHLIFFNRYLANHPQEAAIMLSGRSAVPPKVLMGMVGPAIGIISGVVIGVVAYALAKALASSGTKAVGSRQKARIMAR